MTSTAGSILMRLTTSSTRSWTISLTTATVLAALASPTLARNVTDIRPLLQEAVQTGQAHGVLQGPGAEYIRKTFSAARPIEIEVRRLQPLAEAGCHRLEVTTRQTEVLIQGQRADQTLAWQVSFCVDGRLLGDPKDGLR